MKFNKRMQELMNEMKINLVPKRTTQSLQSKWRYGKDEEGNRVKIPKHKAEMEADAAELKKRREMERKAKGVASSKEIGKLATEVLPEEEGQKIIKTTYETWDEEDLEAGDTDKKGWKDEEGTVFDTVEDAIEWLKKNKATHPSSNKFHTGIWYSAEDEQDIKTGERTTYSFHLYGFTDDEEEKIYNALT